MYEPIKIVLSRAQVTKASNGHPIQIARHNIGHGTTILVHPETARKVHRARMMNKGVRIHLTMDELHGAGLKEDLKKAGKWLKEKVIDTSAYQKYVRPAVRAGLEYLADKAPVGSDQLKKGIAWAGNKTGAFGVSSDMEAYTPYRSRSVDRYSEPDMSKYYPVPQDIVDRPAVNVSGGALRKKRAQRKRKSQKGGSFRAG